MKKIIYIIFGLLLFLHIAPHASAQLQAIPNATAPLEPRDKFQTNLFTGSAGYSYSIKVPQGTNNLTPNVTLTYDHQATHDISQYVGAGWQLNEDYIARDINYTPLDTTDDKYKLHFKGNTYDLIYNPNDSLFHTKIESYLKIQQFLNGGQNTTGMYWQVTTPDGTMYRFGYNTSSELICNGQSYDSTWYPDQVQDTHNNHIYYAYTQVNGLAYPTQITYNNDQQREIDFGYVTNPYQRQMYIQGCNITETNRLNSILVKTSGNVVHEYDINFTQALNGQNLLNTITEKGSDGTSLPATTLTYNPTITNINNIPNYLIYQNGNIDARFNLPYVRLIDVNGDGLPDIVRSETSSQGGGYVSWRVYLNNGNGWNTSSPQQWINSANIDSRLDMTNVQLIDVTGDGLPDIVKSVNTGGTSDTWYVYRNTGNGWSTTPETWLTTTNGGNVPNATVDLNLSNKQVRLVDINGDGLPDIVWSGSTTTMGNRSWIAYLNTGHGWSSIPTYWFNNQPFQASLEMNNVQLIDVNGDGLPDIVRSYNNGNSFETWEVYLNTGSSFPTTPQIWMNNAPTNAELSRGDTILADMNGDGLPDIVRSDNTSKIGHRNWIVYMNQGNSWSTTPQYWVNDMEMDAESNMSDLKIVDINGDGLPDIVRSYQDGTANTWKVWYNTGYATDLLSTVQTQQGGTIHFDYSPSTKFANGVNLPFPLWLTTAMTINNGVTGAQATSDVTNYSYANGWYNWQQHEYKLTHDLTVGVFN